MTPRSSCRSSWRITPTSSLATRSMTRSEAVAARHPRDGGPRRARRGGARSLDHLFLDQDAIPTLVEVKRSTDSRIRREVVGQMLDYAANAVAYWPVEEVRARFEARCGGDGLDAGAVLSGFLGDGQDASAFWQQVKTNLQAGRVRLIFIADEIPPELRRVGSSSQPDGPCRGARRRGQAVRGREPQDARPSRPGSDGGGTPEEDRRTGARTAVGRGDVLQRPP